MITGWKGIKNLPSQDITYNVASKQSATAYIFGDSVDEPGEKEVTGNYHLTIRLVSG